MERRVCRLEELPPGRTLLVPGGRWGIGLFNHKGTVYALNNYCPHAGAPVCRGVITGTTESVRRYDAKWVRQDEILRCPWHGWEFDVTTGKTVTMPERSIKTFPVRVDDDGWVVLDE
jgi:nitrite reductase/ring-hydroxylating ferredoxin subunit